MIKKGDVSKSILVGLTNSKKSSWKSKLKEIEKFKISKLALFLEDFIKPQRKKIYKALLASKVKKIPIVHIRNDMKKQELIFLVRNFGSRYFTIHEDCFEFLEKWRGFYKYLFLEMNSDNFIPKSVDVKKIGGFCIDLSHFKVEEEKFLKEFEYIVKRKKVRKYFACNHLNGYSPIKNKDLHTIRTLKDFDYLKTLPKFLFSKIIALETYNKISEQLRFRRYLVKLLNDKLY